MGAISLAHRGVLFLDELPEFGTRVLEVLRQPMEDRVVTISRARGSFSFPASFMLVGAMNPCPCGYFGDPLKECTCNPATVTRYQKRISGPVMDRIDIHVEVPRVEFEKLAEDRVGEPALMRLSPTENEGGLCRRGARVKCRSTPETRAILQRLGDMGRRDL